MRLARVGLENVVGWIDIDEWPFALTATPQITVAELRESGLPVLDVRGRGEYADGHVDGAINVPLDVLPESLVSIDRGPLAVMCGGGYRSSIATSILERAGFTNLKNVSGGIAAWRKAGLPVT